MEMAMNWTTVIIIVLAGTGIGLGILKFIFSFDTAQRSTFTQAEIAERERMFSEECLRAAEANRNFERRD
jgi:hypothetical protein